MPTASTDAYVLLHLEQVSGTQGESLHLCRVGWNWGGAGSGSSGVGCEGLHLSGVAGSVGHANWVRKGRGGSRLMQPGRHRKGGKQMKQSEVIVSSKSRLT